MEILLNILIVISLASPILMWAVCAWGHSKIEKLAKQGRVEHEQFMREMQEMCVSGLLKRSEIHLCYACEKQMKEFLENCYEKGR